MIKIINLIGSRTRDHPAYNIICFLRFLSKPSNSADTNVDADTLATVTVSVTSIINRTLGTHVLA
jgi:hypothetical protein